MFLELLKVACAAYTMGIRKKEYINFGRNEHLAFTDPTLYDARGKWTLLPFISLLLYSLPLIYVFGVKFQIYHRKKNLFILRKQKSPNCSFYDKIC